MEFIVQNFGTIVVFLVLLLIVAMVIYSMIKSRKQGKNSCGCDCGSGGCPASGCATSHMVETLQKEFKKNK